MIRTGPSRAAGAILAGVIVAIGATAVAAMISDDVRVLDLARDPATLSRSPAHDGLLTILGGFMWSATIAVALFAAWSLSHRVAARRRVRFLIAAAALSTVLMVDDMFLIHERLAPQLGISEEVLFGMYAMGLVILLVEFRELILDTAWPLLAASLMVFAVAFARNRAFGIPSVLLPDTYSFIGIGLWLAFFAHTSVAWVDRLISER